jgi:hypothetical protein
MNVNFFQKLAIRFVRFRPLMTLFARLRRFRIEGERERLCQKMALVAWPS